MSATIIQKNIYLQCADTQFSKKNSTEAKGLDGKYERLISANNLSPSTEIANSNIMCQKMQMQRHSQEENDFYRLHGALKRTISQPQQDVNVTSLVCSLMENLGNINLHRKLERTQSEPISQHVNTSRYKTELCRPFEEAGECKYGEKCQFAHGYNELRNLQRHPKYKTEYCRTFHSVGFCPYGPRCHFVHNADEARTLQQQNNYSSLNNCVPSYPVSTTEPCHNDLKHSLPLSPPLSMSTGSDRESPTGSLSLSPTSSMRSFPFSEQISPTSSSLHANFSYVHTPPPESPNIPLSPINTPPPMIILGAIQNQNQVHMKLVSKPCSLEGKRRENISISTNNLKNVSTNVALLSVNSDDARLPVFNRLSSTIDNIEI